jgi:hypothetical protein
MPVAFVLDENCRGPLWNAIQSHNQRGTYRIDAVRVGDMPDIPLESGDAEILAWAERAGRILLTFDENTMPRYWLAHLQSGAHSPGVFIVRAKVSSREFVQNLAIVAYASDPAE